MSFDSSLAKAIFDGASQRFGNCVGTMTSGKESSSLTRTSNIDFVTERGSIYDIVEFACGSRSMRRVLKPLLATAAERLMAVVVLPTPPFSLATVMMLRPRLPLLFSQVLGIQRLEPLLPLLLPFPPLRRDGLRLI